MILLSYKEEAPCLEAESEEGAYDAAALVPVCDAQGFAVIDTPPSPLPVAMSPAPVPESPEQMCLDENGYAKVSEAGTPLEVAATPESASPVCPRALSFDATGFAMVSDEDEEAAAPAPSKKAKKDYLAAADAAAQEPLPGAKSLKYMFKKPSGLEAAPASKLEAAPASKHPIGHCVNDFYL